MNAQQDSIPVNLDVLHWSDIEQLKEDRQNTKVLAGTRTERNLKDLPFTVYVITAEEIKDLGYFTLVDAIRHLPGIRVSQPGSGIDGETFMMRGLYGNAYTKILINNQTIRPSVTGAMPIASQLPIRQAERIEVIYGPAATLYGADAAAGVINIVLKDSEFPTYAQADIETGANEHTRFNALFGGKYALGNHTLKLKMYGGFTAFNDRRVKYSLDSLYNPEIYQTLFNLQGLPSYLERPNYVGTEGQPSISNLPHQSSYIGFSASIGAFQFESQRLFRADHSSLGLNPLAVSYADPQSLIGEEILTSTLSFQKTFDKWNYKLSVGILNYSFNPLSSYKYVLPTFGLISNQFFIASVAPNSNIDGPSAIDSTYLSGSRYVDGNITDIFIEALFNIKLNKHINLTTGLKQTSGFGGAIQRYNTQPGSYDDRFIAPPAISGLNALLEENTFYFETYADYGPLQAVLGAQTFRRTDDLTAGNVEFNTRAGLLYRFSSGLGARASYSTAFRYPSGYYAASTYTISADDDFIIVETGSPGLEPEQTRSFETGLRYKPSNTLNLDVSMYYSRTTNFINYNFMQDLNNNTLTWGFENDPESFNQLIGTQVHLQIRDLWSAIKLNTDINLNFSKGKERIQTSVLQIGAEGELFDIPAIRAQPDFIGFVRFTFEPIKQFKFVLNNSFMTSSWTRNKLRISNAVQNNNLNGLTNQGYYVLDIRTTFRLSRQLNAYLHIFNVTNTRYAGIDSSPDPDALLFNPQPTNSAVVGVSYGFN
ncbi:MAG: TonB-dependent receptor [Bacteroidota bacterium]